MPSNTHKILKEIKPESEEIENNEKKPEDENHFGFNIADHLDRINELLGLLQGDIENQKENDTENNHKVLPLMDMIHQMMAPGLISGLPLADVSLDENDIEDLNDVRGKITIMTGHQTDDEPMHIEKKTIKLVPKDNECKDSCDIHREKEIVSKISTKIRKIVSGMQKSNNKFASFNHIDDYINSLKLAHRVLVSSNIDNQIIEKTLYYINPSNFAKNIDKNTMYIISSIINDISLCPNYNKQIYQSLAERIKVAYHNLLNGTSMVKQAYYETREENSIIRGFNICPKYKTVKGAGIPVSLDFCQRECIDGKPEDNNKVSCKYAYWLDNIADSHAKVMEKLDVHRNPVNDDMNLRLPDGKRAFPDRGYMKSNELRLEESGTRGREWDSKGKSKKVKSEAYGKMLNYESLMDEILTAENIYRDDSGNNKSTEKKLRDIHGEKTDLKNIEYRLYNKVKDPEKDENNTEFKLSDTREKFNFDQTKLLDELIEKAYPRKDEKRPRGE